MTHPLDEEPRSSATETRLEPKRSMRVDIQPDANRFAEIRLTDDMAEFYHLDTWSKEFSLMTAGYRDRMDPDDAGNPEVPFNLLTVALLADAKAKVFCKKGVPT